MLKPPRFAERLLEALIDGRDREYVLGDLAEQYGRFSEQRGERLARRWYWRQVVGAVVPSLRRRFSPARASRSNQSADGGGDVRTGLGWLDTMRLDVRLAVRHLVKTPGFTVGAVATLGLGLGLATAIFSVVNGVLLRPLPYREPEKLLWIWSNLSEIGVPRANTSGPQIAALRERAREFEGFAAMRPGRLPVTGADGENPEQIDVALTTSNLFKLLGVEPLVGRGFAADEDGAAGKDVAVLSWGLWQRRFGGDGDAIGRAIHLDGKPYIVVGVMPRDFRFVTHTSLGAPENADMWIPLRSDFGAESRGTFSYSLLARIAARSTVDGGIAELQKLASEMGVEFWGEEGRSFRFLIVGLVPDLVGGVRRALIILQSSVLLLLLGVVASQAALLVARADRRTRELTIARAVGASTWSLVRQVLVESGLLALLGGVVGVATAVVALPRFMELVPANLPRRGDIALDLMVFAAVLGATLLVGLLAGILPALRSGQRELSVTLREVGVAEGRASGRKLRSALVVSQIALSLVLVTGAALLARSMRNLLTIDPGFATTGALTFDVQLPTSRYPESAAIVSFLDRARTAIAAVPGVSSVGATTGLPLSTDSDQAPAEFYGSTLRARDPEAARLLVDVIGATPGYIEAMGIRLVHGRDFANNDALESPPVVLIDRALAERHFPDGNAIGQRLNIYGDSTVRVAGVIEHARQYRVDEDGRSQVWFALRQLTSRGLSFAVRLDGDPLTRVPDVRRALATVDPLLPTSNVRSSEMLVADALSERRLALLLVSAFGIVALLLAVLGTYTLVTAVVTQRSREIGIRMAIGARRGQVIRLVLGGAAKIVVAGVVLGAGIALLATRALRSLLFGIAPSDPTTFVVAAATLAAVAIAAAALPARRAARISVSRTLRED
jgi:putative ABC transport system permease protein